jgi:hypothetical protein
VCIAWSDFFALVEQMRIPQDYLADRADRADAAPQPRELF